MISLRRFLIILFLFEHEKRLKRIDSDLLSISKYQTDIDALREQFSDSPKLTEKLKWIENLDLQKPP